MKSIGIILIIGVLTLMSFNSFEKTSKTTSNGIVFFKGNWNDALLKAQKENKVIMLNASATWCRPCKKLKSKTFADLSVGNFYNEHFINVSVDVESPEGEMLAERYRVSGIPATLFINNKGKVIQHYTGYYSPKEFVELGKSIKK